MFKFQNPPWLFPHLLAVIFPTFSLLFCFPRAFFFPLFYNLNVILLVDSLLFC